MIKRNDIKCGNILIRKKRINMNTDMINFSEVEYILNYIDENHIKEIEERFSHYLNWCNSEVENFKPDNKENNEETLNDQ